MIRPPSLTVPRGDTYSADPLPSGYHTAYSAGTSNIGNVTLCQRHADGTIERRVMHPFDAHLQLVIDPRNGVEVVSAWIESGSESDSGWTVSV